MQTGIRSIFILFCITCINLIYVHADEHEHTVSESDSPQ